MLPLKDNIPTIRFPVITVMLIVANVAVFLYEQSLGPVMDRFMAQYGMTPYEVTHGVTLYPRGGLPILLTVFTSMFVHASWLHVGGNMLFLWIFGNNVEDSMGRPRFIAFYLLCGLAATAAQIAVMPSSPIPNVGASGAIAGVLGAYLLLFPRARVLTLIFLGIFVTFVELPAVAVLVLWIGIQVVSGALGISGATSGGIAYFAHIGGFALGLLTIRMFTMGRSCVNDKQRYCRSARTGPRPL